MEEKEDFNHSLKILKLKSWFGRPLLHCPSLGVTVGKEPSQVGETLTVGFVNFSEPVIQCQISVLF